MKKQKASMTLLLLALVLATFSYAYELSYTSSPNNVSIMYDSLNRISVKSYNGTNISYSYDSQYFDTLTNITTNNLTIKYEYDKRKRLTKEIRIIDGIAFEKTYSYDSANRIVENKLPSQDLEFYYNKQGKISKINSTIISAYYNAFGSLLNKTYANNLTSILTYNPQNNRLIQIATNNIQNLNYSYDSVGNILSLQDSVQKLNYSMQYDALDRLITTAINNDLYQYEYSSIGNIKRIVSNSSTKRLNYNNLPHAPSEIIENSAYAGVYSAKDLDLGSKNRTFEFFLVKEKLDNVTNVNYSVNFGQSIFNSNISLNITIPILVLVENNYSYGGLYLINISTYYDANKFNDRFGVDAKELNFLLQNTSLAYFEFIILKDIQEKVINANWNCSDIVSTFPFNITNNTLVFIEYNYSASGDKNIICNVNSSDGFGNKSLDFELKGLEIQNYTLNSLDTNKKQVIFQIKNYWNPLTATWNIGSDSLFFTNSSDMNTSDIISVIKELNYSTDGVKLIDINVSSGEIVDNLIDRQIIKALEINNYDRYDFNNTNRIIIFDIYNKWPSNLSINWNISEPNIRNSTYLNQSQFVMVIMEENYTSQGRKEPEIKAYSNSFLSSLKDRFTIFIIHLLDLQVLKQSVASTVTEFIAKSHSGNKSLSWKYNTGVQVINSNISVYLNESDNLIVLIENNYTTAGVYSVNASVNSSNFSDNAQGVVVT